MNWDEKEAWRKKFLEVLAGFRLLDDDFMTAVFQDSLECVDLLLQIVIDKPIIRAMQAITQDTLKNLHGRSVRLDIHAFAEGQEFDVEVQRADDGATARRARHNASLMDANALRTGEDCDKLPESYVIFITETDVLGYGRPIYRIRRMIEEENVAFGDGSHIIYVNSSMMDEDTPLGRLMHDFHCTRAEDMYYDVLAERVRYFKETEEGASSMCKAMEELARDFAGELAKEAEERGMQRGREDGKIDIVLEMLRGKLPLEMIAQMSKFPLERVKELGKMHSLL
mgnify:FL=1